MPPLRDSAGAGHFGTLYTAVLRPMELAIDYRWPDLAWRQSIAAFDPGVRLAPPPAAAA